VGVFSTLHEVHMTTGTTRWTQQLQNRVFGSPIIGPGGQVIVGTDGGYMWALDPTSQGAQLWMTSCGLETLYTPALTPSGLVVVGYVATLGARRRVRVAV
jgi:outer membrane protein assembly factor BamB